MAAPRSGWEPFALVVVPPEAVLGASTAVRQALSARAGAPWSALEAIASAGIPVVVGSARNDREALAVRDALAREHGVRAGVVTSGGLVWFGLAAVSGALAGLMLIGLLIGLAFFGFSTLVGLSLAAVVAFAALGVWSLARWRRDHGTHRTAWQAILDARRPVEAAPEVWADLFEVRRLSLDPALPPEAQADLWAACDEVEARLAAAPHDAHVQAEIRAALASLRAAPTPASEDRGALARAARAVQAARAELERPGRS